MSDAPKEAQQGAEVPKDTPKEAPKEEHIPKARLDAEYARRKDAERKLDELTKKLEESNKMSLMEQQKFKELWEKDAPKAKLADELVGTIESYLADESSDLTDEQKSLIPDGPAHTKLAWVKKAKKAGVFGTKPNPEKTFTQKPKNDVTPDKWYLTIGSDDSRFESLTTAQYAEWKAHNKGEKVRGGF